MNRKDTYISTNRFECKQGSIETWKKMGRIPDERDVSSLTAHGQETCIFRGMRLK